MILRMAELRELIGLTFDSVTRDAKREELIFAGPRTFRMLHIQDCCESVTLDDVAGELEWLAGTPILEAYEANDPEPEGFVHPDDSHTWTFYRIATVKGTVVLRWYGSSNGYYSERVEMIEEVEGEGVGIDLD